jgi:hypothetical protein
MVPPGCERQSNSELLGGEGDVNDRTEISTATCFLLIVVGLLACRSPQWEVTSKLRAPDADVAGALGDTSSENAQGFVADDIPEIAYPRALRPCCAFGADLHVAVGLVPVPGVEIGNLLGPDELGPHRYDNGYLSLQRKDPRGRVGVENNGLIYTCRGGFIDLAHVRDNADNTLVIVAALARGLETGTTLELPPQGAAMRIRVRPISAEAIAKFGRMQLAVGLAEWLGYQISIWHEIATFYGYTSLAGWPEKLSAFSPEDLYSNELGIRLAGGVILAKAARSDLEYGLSMDAWLERTLQRLLAVPLEDSRTAMSAVDGAWWDSEKRIPDWTLVKRRRFDTGPLLNPWRLEDARPGTKGDVKPLSSCLDADPALVFRVSDGFAGALYRDYATAEFEVGDALVEAGFLLPRPGTRRVDQEDFPAIIGEIRKATLEAFGLGADAP